MVVVGNAVAARVVITASSVMRFGRSAQTERRRRLQRESARQTLPTLARNHLGRSCPLAGGADARCESARWDELATSFIAPESKSADTGNTSAFQSRLD